MHPSIRRLRKHNALESSETFVVGWKENISIKKIDVQAERKKHFWVKKVKGILNSELWSKVIKKKKRAWQEMGNHETYDNLGGTKAGEGTNLTLYGPILILLEHLLYWGNHPSQKKLY